MSGTIDLGGTQKSHPELDAARHIYFLQLHLQGPRSEGWQFDFWPLQRGYPSAIEQLHGGWMSFTGPLPVSSSWNFIIRNWFVICAVTMVTALV